jgi:hypothetical protein
MSENKIRWGAAAGGAVLAEVLQIAAAFVWVAIYSHVINPDQSIDVYRQHAQASGPWVSIFGGFPIFFGVSRMVTRNVPTALAMFAIFLVIDVVLLTVSPGPFTAAFLGLAATSYVTKLLACYLGGRAAAARIRSRAA